MTVYDFVLDIVCVVICFCLGYVYTGCIVILDFDGGRLLRTYTRPSVMRLKTSATFPLTRPGGQVPSFYLFFFVKSYVQGV